MRVRVRITVRVRVVRVRVRITVRVRVVRVRVRTTVRVRVVRVRVQTIEAADARAAGVGGLRGMSLVLYAAGVV